MSKKLTPPPRLPIPAIPEIGHDDYKKMLIKLQIELVKLQRDVINLGRKILIILEGRDAGGERWRDQTHYQASEPA